ncbi:MAG: type II toxin-antitoxin system RelE/ParE family toxin [Defluviitaleaceae bacterium]|nr:type II toxin-antitoxin system RelE/ParE family toxin [Defluviitaleaceae bacterium]
MAYEIRYQKSAIKYLDKQTKATRTRIMDAIDLLPSGEVKKLQGRKGYRLSIGDFRVIFDFTEETNEEGAPIIYVDTIAPRGDVYKV